MNLRKLLLRELKVMAGKWLGKGAAALKTKDELIAALEKVAGLNEAGADKAAKAAKADKPGKVTQAAKPTPKPGASPKPKADLKPKLTPVSAAEVKPKPVEKPVTWTEPKPPKAEVRPVKPLVAAKEPKESSLRPVKTSSAVATSKSVGRAPAQLRAVPAPAPMAPAAKKAEAAPTRRATVTQDFFMLPGSVKLPQAHGDDRVLAFPKDTGGLYAAWDFSARTWAGGGAVLEVVGAGDEVLTELALDAPCGGRFIELSPPGPVAVRVRRGGQQLGRSAWLSLPHAKAGAAPRTRLKVKWGEPLPTHQTPVKSRRKLRAGVAAGARASGSSPGGEEWLEEGWGEAGDVTSRV